MADDAPAFGVHDGERFVECSVDLAEMFGYGSPEDVVGCNTLEIIETAYRDHTVKQILISGGGPYQSVGIRPDGVKFRVEISAHPVRYGGHNARLILVRDLSPRALVVDDNEVVRNMEALLFRKLGYRVTRAESAKGALIVFRPDAFAVVLTDIVMPQINGIELAATLRATDPTLPILLTTGFASVPMPTDAGYRMLRKPFGFEDLSRELASLPERARRGLVTE